MKTAVSSVIAAGLLSAASALAEEPKRVEPVVVTATKIAESQERLGAAVTVISGDDLKLYDYPTVGDALRAVPGLEVQRSGGLGKLTEVRIRGASTSQIQVLIDGVRVKSPTVGTFDFSDVSIENIERIEIVRGPQSTLYGADAIGGVVHIITKRGQGPFSAFASSEFGNYDTMRHQAGFSGGYRLLDYAVSGSWSESKGQFKNDGFEQRGFTARVGITLPADGHLGLSLRYNRNAVDLPVDFAIPTSPFFVRDPDAGQQSETTTLSLQWDQRPVKWFEVHARLGGFWNQTGFQDPFTPGDVAAGNFDTLNFKSQIDTRRREAELIAAFHAGDWNTLTVGGEHRTESGRIRSTGVVTEGDLQTLFRQIDTASYFVQDELRLFDRVVLSAGRRQDHNSAFGTATTHRASAVLLVKEIGTKLRGSWGEGFRAPTIDDLFFPNFGNPDLRPERSESWDAGVEQKLWRNRLRLGLTYFENRFSNLIQATSTNGIDFRPENVGRARSRGWEFSAEADLLDTLFLNASYTHTDSKDLDKDLPLRRVAPDRYNAGLTWEPLRALVLYAQAYVVSSQFEQEGFPRNPGYYHLDVGGVYHLARRRGAFPALDLTARINNVTDQRYMEVFGFRSLGINALVGLQAKY
jgi:vitamin B12 transporter